MGKHSFLQTSQALRDGGFLLLSSRIPISSARLERLTFTLKDALRGGAPRFLKFERMKGFPGCVLGSHEFRINLLPEHLDEALGVLRTLSKTESLDIHLCPLSWVEQFPKLWVFDVDSTLIFQETIDELAALSDQKETVSKITQEAMEGKLPFDQALVARLKLIEGTPVEALQQVDESLKIRPEMEQLVNWVRNWGCQVAFVSGGFTFFVSRLANKLRVPHYHANELVLQKGKVTGEVSPPIVTGAEKAKFVDRLISKLNLKKKDVAVIGDGANDRHMMSKAAVTVGYNPKPALEPHVALVVRHSHILSILGIWQRSLVSG